jgi:hypothetical protein
VIKNVFELTFNIEKFLVENEISKEFLSFEEFMGLFESNEESKSLISAFTRNNNKGDE